MSCCRCSCSVVVVLVVILRRQWETYIGAAASEKDPERQQVPSQTEEEDQDVEHSEGSHLIVDDALAIFTSTAGVGGGGCYHHNQPLPLQKEPAHNDTHK